MRFLCYEILRTMVFSNREAGHTGSCGRKWIKARAIVDHVTEIKIVIRSQIMINSQAPLIEVISLSYSGSECERSVIGLRKEREQALGKGAEERWGQLVKGKGSGCGTRD